MSMQLEFQTIDLNAHGAQAAKFREDSYVASFGSAQGFQKMGTPAYLEWLKHRIEAYPGGHVHVWHGRDLVGQIEARPHKQKADLAYVNLYYVAPKFRRMGIGRALDAYATEHFRDLGRTRVQLSVSPTNTAAWSFYLTLGYQDKGQRADSPEVHRMERLLSS